MNYSHADPAGAEAFRGQSGIKPPLTALIHLFPCHGVSLAGEFRCVSVRE